MTLFARTVVTVRSACALLALNWLIGGGARADNLLDLQVTGRQTIDGFEVLSTSGTALVRLANCPEGAIRVEVAPSGLFGVTPSFAVGELACQPRSFATTDAGAYWRFSTTTAVVRVYKSPLHIDFYTPDDATLLSGETLNFGGGHVTSSAGPAVSRMFGPLEHFYGLGEDNNAYLGNLDRRGSRRELWTGQKISRGHVTADMPIPLLISSGEGAGTYGFFFDNSHRTVFDLGQGRSDSWTWSAAGGDLRYYFVPGPTYHLVLERYTALTGRPPLPPQWVLGYIQSKCTYGDWDELDEVSNTLRAKGFPLDAMVFDFDWPEDLQNFKWHARWQGQSPAKIRAYLQRGIHFLISNSGPMIRQDSSNYADGLAHGVFATDGRGHTVQAGYYLGDLLDFSLPNFPTIKDWLWPQLRHLYDEGIAGWWLDLTEPENEPPETMYRGGPSALIHNAFSQLNSRAYYEMQKAYAPDSRPFILTRTGYAGIQRYGAALWSGDINSDYETLQAHVPEALNAGMSGIALWTHDAGGFLQGYYKDNLADHGKLYARWLQFASMTPIARAHHVGYSAPYMFGAEVEAITRKYLQLRARLLPYLYAQAWTAHLTGVPIMRPVFFEFPTDPRLAALKDEFMLGPDLLIAPVLSEGVNSRHVYLPAGLWFDYETGQSYQGPGDFTVAAPLERLPIFVRGGAIIPTIPFMQYAGERAWEPLQLEVFPGPAGTQRLYQDDGRTTAYERGQYTETWITATASEKDAVQRLNIRQSNQLFVPGHYQVNLHRGETPLQVAVNGQVLAVVGSLEDLARAEQGWLWDGAAAQVRIKFSAMSGAEYTVVASNTPL